MRVCSEIKEIVKNSRAHRLWLINKQYDQIIKENKELSLKLSYMKEHYDIRDMLPEKGYSRSKQMELVLFVKSFLKEISSLDIKPFLIAGSLLGEFRHKGFVPWDDDIDFGLIRSEYNILIDYCKNRMPVYIYDDKPEKQSKWIDRCTKDNSGKYILFIYDNQIQVSKGSSILDRQCIDFFSFDFFEEELSFSDYKSYLEALLKTLNVQGGTVLDKYKFIQNEILNRHHTVNSSSKIYYGLDNMETFKRMFNDDWIPYDVVFPLKKRKFEEAEFWTPNKDERFLQYQYQDYYTYPNDFAQQAHGYWIDYMRKEYITVEFYLVDAFEIYHFVPYYHEFRKRGVYAIFVAEPPELNVAGKWFNYEQARQILIDNCLEYVEMHNKYATYAFTTQDAINLKMYSQKTVRINLSYGYGLIKKSYAFCDRVLKGFDYKIVNGEFQSRQLSLHNANTRLLMGGLAKYSSLKNFEKEDVLHELGIIPNKPILVYFPTYDDECCADVICECSEEIRNKYYLVVKLHHCLDRLAGCADIKRKLVESADYVLPGNYPFEKAASVADVVVADAKSGAGMEAVFLNPKSKIILLVKHENVLESYFDEINELGRLALTKEELLEHLREDDTEIARMSRITLVEECYGKKSENYVGNVVEKILEYEELVDGDSAR